MEAKKHISQFYNEQELKEMKNKGLLAVYNTQRNDARIISGTIQNNPLDINTKLKVLRKK